MSANRHREESVHAVAGVDTCLLLPSRLLSLLLLLLLLVPAAGTCCSCWSDRAIQRIVRSSGVTAHSIQASNQPHTTPLPVRAGGRIQTHRTRIDCSRRLHLDLTTT